MITEAELLALMGDLESDRIERTRSTTDTTKFREAICAFANDFPGHRKSGFLLLGVDDKTGSATGLVATDALLRNLGGLRQDGEILPQPAMEVYPIRLSDGSGDVVVAEVHPSDLPPVRSKGRVWIRVGPRKALANESEERRLGERRAATARSFDARPCEEATIRDLHTDVFLEVYRQLAVAEEVIESNHRAVEEQLAALRFYHLGKDCPTHAGVLVFGGNPLHFLSGAYVQYLHLGGTDLAAPVRSAQEFKGSLRELVRALESHLMGILESRPFRVSTLRDETVHDYPRPAVRELLLNAICHRNYESNAPIRFHRFEDRLEIINPGGLYGDVNPENFPRQTDYRNPVVAEALRTLGVVNRFGRGVLDCQRVLRENGNDPAEFLFEPTSVTVTVRKSPRFSEAGI
ncbi:MAG: putative DNA binding domain-containing protein [Akkermansiaceae bacterium]|nr:putative DNA binding domain-containing protein [Akkermansiaceae bacterium]